MPRSRKNTQTQNTKEITDMSATTFEFETLDDKQVAETQSQTRSRGDYDIILGDFVASGSRGVRVPAAGLIEGRKPGAIKSGLEGAVKRMEKKAEGSAAGLKVVLFKSGTGDAATEEVRLLNANAGQ